MKKFFRPLVILPIVLGVILGLMLFILGDIEDAPGISAAGLLLGYVLVLMGINKAGVIKKGLFLPVLFLSFAVFITLLGTAALLDGEFGDTSWQSVIVYIAAALFLVVGIIKLRSFRKKKAE